MNEIWDQEEASVPPRSRLYHLEPIGVGTHYAESLTSYIIRLAGAHRVLPKILVTHEILPLLGRPGRSKTSSLYSYTAWSGNVQTLNGTSAISEKCVGALEKLTGCDNLRALTMLTWANVVRKRGLLRSTQAWCPLCCEEWQTNNDAVYYPLLWSLRMVRVCLRHRRFLEEVCPYQDCRGTLPVFATGLRLGYCPGCNRWLGGTLGTNSSEAVIGEEFELAYRDAAAIGELIEYAPRLPSPLQRESLSSAITFILDYMPTKNVASLARQLGMRHNTIMSWQKGENSPQIDTLLLLCRLLGISPLHFFCERSPLTNFAPVRKGSEERPIILKEKRTALSSDELRLALEAVLMSEEESPPSIDEVAKRLGYRGRTPLYRRFPELCRAITARHQKHDPNCRRLHRQRMSADELQQALESALMSDEDPPPSVEEVAKRLGYRSSSALYSRFPGLCRAITARHLEQYTIEHLQSELEAVLESADSSPSPDEVAQRLGCPGRMLREQFPELWSAITRRYTEPLDIVDLRAALEKEIQSHEEPRSMRQIAQALGHPVQTFLRLFPDECHEISARRQAYRKRNNELRRQVIQNEVLRAVLAIEAEKAYPSQRRVMERVDRFCVCPPLFELEVHVPWKETLVKRGYQV